MHWLFQTWCIDFFEWLTFSNDHFPPRAHHVSGGHVRTGQFAGAHSGLWARCWGLPDAQRDGQRPPPWLLFETWIILRVQILKQKALSILTLLSLLSKCTMALTFENFYKRAPLSLLHPHVFFFFFIFFLQARCAQPSPLSPPPSPPCAPTPRCRDSLNCESKSYICIYI